MEFVSERMDDIPGKEENTSYLHFPLFKQRFPKAFFFWGGGGRDSPI